MNFSTSSPGATTSGVRFSLARTQMRLPWRRLPAVCRAASLAARNGWNQAKASLFWSGKKRGPTTPRVCPSVLRRTALCVTLAWVSAVTSGTSSTSQASPAFSQVFGQSYKSSSWRAVPRPCQGVSWKKAIVSISCAIVPLLVAVIVLPSPPPPRGVSIRQPLAKKGRTSFLAWGGEDLFGLGVHDEPVQGGFVRVPKIQAILVQPRTHVGPLHEVEKQPVVARAAGVVLAVVVTRLVATWLPEEGDEPAPAVVTEGRQEAGQQLERCFQCHVSVLRFASVFAGKQDAGRGAVSLGDDPNNIAKAGLVAAQDSPAFPQGRLIRFGVVAVEVAPFASGVLGQELTGAV